MRLRAQSLFVIHGKHIPILKILFNTVQHIFFTEE